MMALRKSHVSCVVLEIDCPKPRVVIHLVGGLRHTVLFSSKEDAEAYLLEVARLLDLVIIP